MIMGCIPAHAAYFSIYEYSKEKLGVNRPGHSPFAAGACGVLGTIAHDLIMNPMDVMKQRLQLGYYNGLTDCFRNVLKTEGLRGFYASLPTTLVMNVPYGAILVASHESIKESLNPSGRSNTPVFLFSGACAGALAAACTNPFDVVKTRLQTQGVHISSSSSRSGVSSSYAESGRHRHNFSSMSHARSNVPLGISGVRTTSHVTPSPRTTPQISRGIISAVQHIYAEEGYRGFFRGVRPRVMAHAPAMGISWGTYETAKRYLGGKN